MCSFVNERRAVRGEALLINTMQETMAMVYNHGNQQLNPQSPAVISATPLGQVGDARGDMKGGTENPAGTGDSTAAYTAK